MLKWLVRGGALVAVSVLLGACESMVLPDFNGGVLNPDIRFLRAGEVMNGVKCAMTEFMRERELQLLDQRKVVVLNRKEEPEKFLTLYVSEYPKFYRRFEKSDRRSSYRQHDYTGSENPFSPYALHVDQGMWPDKTVTGEKECNFRGGRLVEYQSSESFLHWEAKKNDKCGSQSEKCPDSNHPNCVYNKYYCPAQLGVVMWDYGARDVYGRLPDDMNSPGIGNCAPVPDYSRFALDYTQQASIDLQLTATNQGTVFYDLIDASRLGPLRSIIAGGDKLTGAVFPKADFTGKGTTTFDLSVQMPQTLFLAAITEDAAPSKLGKSPAPSAKLGEIKEKAKKLKDHLSIAKELKNKLSNESKQNSANAINKDLIERLANAESLARSIDSDKRRLDIQNQSVFSEFLKSKKLGDELKEIETYLKSDVDVTERNVAVTSIQEIKDKVASASRVEKGLSRVTPAKPLAASGSDSSGRSYGTRLQSTAGNFDKDVFSSEELRIVRGRTPLKLFSSGCGVDGVMHIDDKTDLDYLALKDLMLKVVAEQNEQVKYEGGPEISLDTITLTSSFDILLDLSAGTKHIFRLFPMVAPPQMGVRSDHLHQLKLTMHGSKQKGDPNGPANLERSCIERVRKKAKQAVVAGTPGAEANAESFCGLPVGKMLESIIEATQQSKGGASSGGATTQ